MDRGGAVGVGSRADAGAKTVTFTVPGPFSGDIKLPRQSFWIRSMSITNNTDATMFLSDTLYPVTNANAALRIPSRTMYEVHDWSNDTIFVGLSAALLTGDWITFQMSDHLTPLSSAPLPAGVGFPFSADNFVWDGAAWQRWVQVTGDGLPMTGMGAVAAMVVDPGTGTMDRMSNAQSDNISNRGRIGVTALLFNPVAGTWDRPREPTADAAAATGIASVGPMVWNGATWDRLQAPAGDAQAAAAKPGVLPMVWNGTTWDRWKEPTADAQAPTGLGGIAPAIFNPSSGLWDRLRGVGADGLGGAGLLTNQPTLLNGAAFDRARSASAANLAATSGLGVTLAALPGMWNLSHNPGVAGTVASATRGAVAATRHVITAIAATVESVGTGLAQLVTVMVRDGATGVGPILFQQQMGVPNVAGQCDHVDLSGLSIVGSVNTQMTIEFNGNGPNTYESVWAGGYEAT